MEQRTIEGGAMKPRPLSAEEEAIVQAMTPQPEPGGMSQNELQAVRDMLGGKLLPTPPTVATRLVALMLVHIDHQAAELDALRNAWAEVSGDLLEARASAEDSTETWQKVTELHTAEIERLRRELEQLKYEHSPKGLTTS